MERVILTGTPGVLSRVRGTVRGTLGVQRGLVTVQRTPGVVRQRVVTVWLELDVLGLATPGVHCSGLWVQAGQRLAEQLHSLQVGLSGRLRVLLALTQGPVSFFVLLGTLALVIAAAFAYVHLAGGEHVQNIRKFEGRQIAVGHDIRSSLSVRFSPGVEAVHQFVLHDTALGVSQLQLHRLAALVVLTGVGEALLDVHVVHVLVVTRIHQHRELLPDLHSGVNFFRLWIFSNLEIHPTIHGVSLELHLLEVQHLDLEWLELDPFLD